MRREGIVTPRSYASVATMANSCAANRDPRRSARNVTCKRANRSSSAGAASSPAPSKAGRGAGAARGDEPRLRPGARGRRTDARNVHADHAGVAHDIVFARRIIATNCGGRSARRFSKTKLDVSETERPTIDEKLTSTRPISGFREHVVRVFF
jgi:hypothetical protein